MTSTARSATTRAIASQTKSFESVMRMRTIDHPTPIVFGMAVDLDDPCAEDEPCDDENDELL